MADHRAITDKERSDLNNSIEATRSSFPLGNWCKDVDDQVFSPEVRIQLFDLREAVNFDVGNIAANGGLLASDTTPLLSAINAATDGCQQVTWDAANTDQVIFQIPLVDLDASEDIVIRTRIASEAGQPDAVGFQVDAFLDEGGTIITVNSPTNNTDTFTTVSTNLPSAQLTENATTLTVGLTPVAHANDEMYLTSISVAYRANKF